MFLSILTCLLYILTCLLLRDRCTLSAFTSYFTPAHNTLNLQLVLIACFILLFLEHSLSNNLHIIRYNWPLIIRSCKTNTHKEISQHSINIIPLTHQSVQTPLNVTTTLHGILLIISPSIFQVNWIKSFNKKKSWITILTVWKCV